MQIDLLAVYGVEDDVKKMLNYSFWDWMQYRRERYGVYAFTRSY